MHRGEATVRLEVVKNSARVSIPRFLFLPEGKVDPAIRSHEFNETAP